MFKIITPVYNSEEWISKCIKSVRYQYFSNWQHIIIDDCSTDKTLKVIKKTVGNDRRFTILSNNKRLGIMENTIQCINIACNDDDDIIVMLDGDDWLVDNTVLSYLNYIYQDPSIWVTWGQFKLLSTNKYLPACTPIDKNFTRKKMIGNSFTLSHLKTFKHFLYKEIRDIDLRNDDGEYYAHAGAGYFMLPILEMAGCLHGFCVPKILYCYNDTSNINVFKHFPKQQVAGFQNFLTKEPYKKYENISKKSYKKIDEYKKSHLHTEVALLIQ